MPVVTRITALNIRGYHPSRTVAIIIFLAVVLLALTLFFSFGLPPVVHDLREFTTDLPQHIPTIVAKLKKIPLIDRLGIDSIVRAIRGRPLLHR